MMPRPTDPGRVWYGDLDASRSPYQRHSREQSASPRYPAESGSPPTAPSVLADCANRRPGHRRDPVARRSEHRRHTDGGTLREGLRGARLSAFASGSERQVRPGAFERGGLPDRRRQVGLVRPARRAAPYYQPHEWPEAMAGRVRGWVDMAGEASLTHFRSDRRRPTRSRVGTEHRGGPLTADGLPAPRDTRPHVRWR